MAKKTRTYSPESRSALSTLGALVAAGRRRRGWSGSELAARLGVDAKTVTRIEHGVPTVAAGLVFDAAVLCGVELFDAAPHELPARERRAAAELTLLPARIRSADLDVSDDF